MKYRFRNEEILGIIFHCIASQAHKNVPFIYMHSYQSNRKQGVG